MYRLENSVFAAPVPDHEYGRLDLRTYREIARILSERTGIAMTRAHVAKMCRAAEEKFTLAFLTDPVLRRSLIGRVATRG